MTKMKIQDIRFQSNCFQKEVDRPLTHMLSDIGHNFLSKIKYQFEVENTRIVLFSFGNTDDNRNVISKDYFRLGDKEIGHIGQTSFDFSEKEFLSLSDEQKRLFLLEIFYKSIKDFAIHFNENVELLDEAYHRILNKGFYGNVTGFIVTRNKLYKCWVEKLLNYKNADYRLAFQDNTTSTIEYYYMVNKESVVTKANSDVKLLLTTPRSFHVEGWKKKEFRVRWGEYGNELYIFDMETKTLRMEINEVQLPDFLK